MRYYLLPIADREPLVWILREQRTAFAEHRSRAASALEIGDVLFLYTTRGCFRNPKRDRGRIIGRAVVASRATTPSGPPIFGERAYPHVVGLNIQSLAPALEGVELAPLVSRLGATFPDPETWSVRMRRALVPLDDSDAALIARELDPVAGAYSASLPAYEGLATAARRRA